MRSENVARDYGLPTLEVEAGLASISLNRPDQHNRLGVEDISHIRDFLVQLDGAKDVRAIILAARGKSFCSGYDISALSDKSGAADAGFTPGGDFGRLCDALEAVRQPTVCALNGSLYGGAIDLALACDFRVGHGGIHMSMPASKLGLHYYGSGMMRYVSRLGLPTSKRLFLLAERIDGREMIDCGFLDYVVAPEKVSETAKEIALRLASHAPTAVQLMKRSLNEIAAQNAALEELQRRFEISIASSELTEGLSAFAQKRAPIFGVQ